MLVVFGGLNADGVLTGATLPGAGETVVGASYALFPGGKGANQAVAAARFGAEVAMVGCVGRDANAEIPLAALREHDIDTSRVSTDSLPTAYASIWVDPGGENRIIVASGANFAIRPTQLDDALLERTRWALFQLEVPEEANFAAIARAHRAGAKVLLNTAPYAPVPEAVLRCVDVLVANEVEAAAMADTLGGSGTGPGPDSSCEPELAAAEAIASRFDLVCVLTLGADGAMVVTADEVLTVPTLAVPVVDTTGAGDTFVGTLAAALAADWPLAEATRAGCVAGALACTRLGAQSGMPSREEIDQHLALHSD